MGFAACRICHGMSKKKCVFCGQKVKKKMDMTDRERLAFEAREIEIDWLRTLYRQMLALKQRSTGCESLDARVRAEIGEWHF